MDVVKKRWRLCVEFHQATHPISKATRRPMSTHQIFTIGTPCHEDWKKMTKVEKGRFCDACAKCVVDLTGKSQKEIKDLYVEHEGNLCGSMPAPQYRATQEVVNRGRAGKSALSFRRSRTISSIQIFAACFVAAFGLMLGSSAMGQSGHHGIKKGKIAYVAMDGNIRGEVVKDGEAVSNVTVTATLNGEQVKLKTDENGQFSFRGLTPGNWSVSVYADGFEAYQMVNLRRGKTEKVVLEMAELLMLGDIAEIEWTEEEEEIAPVCGTERITGDTILVEIDEVNGVIEEIEIEEKAHLRGEIKAVEMIEPVELIEEDVVMIAGGIGPRVVEVEPVELSEVASEEVQIQMLPPVNQPVFGTVLPGTVDMPEITDINNLPIYDPLELEIDPDNRAPEAENAVDKAGTLAVEGFEAVVKPIPTDDELTVQIKSSLNNEPIELLIFSTEGKLVKTGAISGAPGSVAKFNLSNLPAGVYYLKGLQDDYLFQQKILKL